MPTEPLVFIVIVNWNGKQVTLDCLESLALVTYPRVRTIVVDNGSADASVDAIRSRFPSVDILPMKENLRFAGGTNRGLEYALARGGDLFLLLNNDTVVHPEFLTHMVQRLVSSATIGLVAPKIYYHRDPNRLWFAGGSISMWTGTLKHTGIRETDNGQYDTPGMIDYASGCCALTSRAVLEKVGMLDESYAMYTEDADWSMRIRKAGYSIMYEPLARVWHKVSVSSGGHLSWFKMKNKFVSNLRFFFRHAAWYQRLVFPWANILVNGYAAIRYVLQSRKV
jgi:GT2 family glycosyltransferase